jgi:hypothetical protein
MAIQQFELFKYFIPNSVAKDDFVTFLPHGNPWVRSKE